MDTLGHLLALHVTAASEQDREQLAEPVQQITGDQVELAYVDQGYTGEAAQNALRGMGFNCMWSNMPIVQFLSLIHWFRIRRACQYRGLQSLSYLHMQE